MQYRLMTDNGSVSRKLYDLESARAEMKGSKAIIAIVTRNKHNVYETDASDVAILTARLIAAGATRAKVIAIVDGYGDAVDWNYHSLDSIIAEVWQSDLNSGDEPENWIINEICSTFNIEEVKG
jgi:hypothetical protein